MNGQIEKLFADESVRDGVNGKASVSADGVDGNKNSEQESLLKGLLLGSTEGLSESQVDDFKISNLSHILAVSGMHIAYIITATMFVFSVFNIRKQFVHILTIFVIIFFMFLTGFTPSVVRASVMGILVLSAFLFKRKADVWISISLASLLTLTYNPYILLSLSYQLSYLGTIGIILGMKVVKAYRNRKSDGVTKRDALGENVVRSKKKSIKENMLDNLSKIKKFFLDAIIVCISAQLFVFPIILLNFNTFSLYFLISNILVSIVMCLVIILGFLVVLVSYVCFPLANILNYIETWLLRFY